MSGLYLGLGITKAAPGLAMTGLGVLSYGLWQQLMPAVAIVA